MDKVIDMHVHYGAPKDLKSPCYWSDKFETTPAYYFMKLTSGSLFKKLTREQIENLLIKTITGARLVDNCVLLAMDKVFDENGNERDDQTHLYVPNSYIVGLAKEYNRILFGASVHPYRNDWKKELTYCIENGARLCKWIPSSQQIDPMHPKCEPFYEMLIKHKLPLLMHAGPEYAIPTSNPDYNEKNNPKYLRKALELGVIVIVAHCSLPYFNKMDTVYQDDLEEYFKLISDAQKNNWKLYSDLSAITTPLRNSYVKDIKAKVPTGNLLFGSDYPVPASELSYKKDKDPFKWLKLAWEAFRIRNPIDKNYVLINRMGFDKTIFTNASRLFDEII